MIYSNFKDCRLSKLGFGAMRLPLSADGKNIDRATTFRMVDKAIAEGINYFDTAYPYHGGMSEIVLGEALQRYPRQCYFLADKYPGHQTADTYDPATVFENQLKKCGVTYFDFYLLHNVCESCLDVYLSEKWKIVDYFVEQRRQGRIRHLGFSSHADLPALRLWLDSPQGQQMEFGQIQLNYMDWTLQKGHEKCALLTEYGLPIWVMEPVRGGKLAMLPEDITRRMRHFRPDESTASWAFRWLQTIPDATIVLSGMSSLDQLNDNLHTFNTERPLTTEELALLTKVSSLLTNFIPCTACRYCCDECPQGLDIPTLIACCNDLRLEPSLTPGMRIEYMTDNKKPSNCITCGACANACPQKIDIPSIITELNERLKSVPKWADICRHRNELAQKQLAESNH